MPEQTLDYSRPSRLGPTLIRLSKRARQVLGMFVVAISIYVASYLAFSLAGHFEPGPFDANGIMWYQWAPAVLVSDYTHRWPIIYFYAPLVIADHLYWHDLEKSRSGRYPQKTPSYAVEWAELRK